MDERVEKRTFPILFDDYDERLLEQKKKAVTTMTEYTFIRSRRRISLSYKVNVNCSRRLANTSLPFLCYTVSILGKH